MDEAALELMENERQALRRFIVYLQETFPEEIDSISLFGSKARGDSQPDSEVDVLVLEPSGIA